MKGHLGFPCRVCAKPSAPLNLRQIGTGSNDNTHVATLAWDEPSDVGRGPITGYRVEMLQSGVPYEWQTLATTSASVRQADLVWCRLSGIARVVAQNRCGFGLPSNAFNGWEFVGISTRLYTSSGTIVIPCFANSFKVWCVGKGGTSPDGGVAGGLVWKTYAVDQTADAPIVVVQNQQTPYTAVTYRGQTLTVNGGDFPGGASGYDGATSGGPGGRSIGSADWSSVCGMPQSHGWRMGGAVAGRGDYYEARATSPCMRIPINTSQDGGVLAAAAACGLKTVEDCGTAAAFGSGGVKIECEDPYGAYASYFAPGYGGGGFDANCPGGGGCVIVAFSG